MAEQSKPVEFLPIQEAHPSPTIPTIYADFVPNLAPGTQTIKFYLARAEPNSAGVGPYRNQVVAQVVMPSGGFLNMMAFFQYAIPKFIEGGIVSKEAWEAAKKIYEGQ
jgi:hypothetical protein